MTVTDRSSTQASRPTGDTDRHHHLGAAVERPRKLLTVLSLAIAAGLLVAAVVAPVVLGAGFAAKSASDHFEGLPTALPTPTLGRDSVILASDGSRIATLHGAENRVPVKIAQVPAIMQTAIVDIEDNRFYSHDGIDYKGLLRAALTDSGGSVSQGGSTITQQYVKNVLLYSADSAQAAAAATDKSIARKVREARLALALEERWSKSQILEGYLNIVYFGQGAYGIGAAAERYFGETVNQLTLPQAALLAGLVQSPSAYDPIVNPKAALKRRTEVLHRMQQLGHLTAAQEREANASPLALRPVAPPAVADPCLSSTAPFFCDYVRNQLLNDPALGSTKTIRQQRLLEGGLTIKTTLDPAIQADAQSALNQTVEPSNSVTVAEAIVQPGTGNVLAMAVNKPYGTGPGETTIPVLTTAALQPGSTFKVFTLTAALAQGLPLSTSFYAPACYVSPIYHIGIGDGSRNPELGCANGFSNADPAEAATYDMTQATWQSVNTYYIQLEQKVGLQNVANMAIRLGVPAKRLAGLGPNDGSLTIGAKVVSPLDMATAYATLAAHGLRCDPRGTLSATTPDGQAVKLTARPACQQVIPSSVADQVTSVLEGVITNGTGYPNAYLYGRPAAGKTGTTDGYSSAWFVGYTPQLAAAVEAGNIESPVAKPLMNIYAGGRYYSQVFGGDIPALAWGRTLTAALANQPYATLPPPATG
jgi:membrane peptidoglycan carboxypeptidase